MSELAISKGFASLCLVEFLLSRHQNNGLYLRCGPKASTRTAAARLRTTRLSSHHIAGGLASDPRGIAMATVMAAVPLIASSLDFLSKAAGLGLL